ncbi:hypothetical protein TSUD_196760 [Trifolium subterraneum]|uniref:F-box domain-containing protein n=1 Tax=Trifolium subterraneum TaxID=3900 RepID=A0A2Z6ND24_TRISU|nr:hypothetical protein TSUD_196760 [Trifolium subterraneum]
MNGKWVFVVKRTFVKKRTKVKRNNLCRGRRFTEKKTNPQLPHELIVQILLRLPVKSLTRFKCVCKSWFSLIFDPHFANSHFQITAAPHTSRILFISASPPHETLSIDFEASSLGDDTASVSLNPNFMPFQSYSHIEIKGSCRGFLLLRCKSQQNHRSIYLWNPSTGFHKKIPWSCNNLYFKFYGFGYDRSKDDYLLVSLSYDSVLSHLEIFSLRANAWKEIVGTTHLPFYSDVSCSSYPLVESLFNGAIHWMTIRHDIYVRVIVAFHLMERKLLEIPLPVDIDYDSTYCDSWVFKGFLSLWVVANITTVDIWVMKEYQVHSSWSKTLVLTTDFFHNIIPICCTKRGDIIGTDGITGLVVKYNNKGEFLEHNTYGNNAHGHLITYTESLLSLHSDSEQA